MELKHTYKKKHKMEKYNMCTICLEDTVPIINEIETTTDAGDPICEDCFYWVARIMLRKEETQTPSTPGGELPF